MYNKFFVFDVQKNDINFNDINFNVNLINEQNRKIWVQVISIWEFPGKGQPLPKY